MGMVVREVTFDGCVPTAMHIAKQMEELAGLQIALEENGPEICGDLYDLSAHLAFARFPQDRIKIVAYRPSTTKKDLKKDIEETGMSEFPVASRIQGANESPGTQTVFLQGFMGQEPTVLIVANLALERLGGRLHSPIADELRKEYDRRITVGELELRHRKVRRQALLRFLVGVLTMPIWLPLQLLLFGWHMVTLPWRIRKARKLIERYLPKKPQGG